MGTYSLWAEGRVKKLLTTCSWIRHIVVEALDVDGNRLGKSKVVETIPPDRTPENFVEEQKWLEKYVQVNATYEPVSTLDDSSLEETELWPETVTTSSHSTLLAYVAGVCTCVLAFVLYQIGVCFRTRHQRQRQVQRYTILDKDEPEDDYELQRSSGSTTVNGLHDKVNGRIDR
jgi:hypothetical protein